MQPPRKQRRAVTYLLFAVAVALVAVGAAAMPHLRNHLTPPPPNPPPLVELHAPPPANDRPRVEVVFALDTTGSMSGLIDGAKRKIWSLVDFISSAEPRPDVRIGLVAYRDVGDAYVTRFYDLSSDLDGVFQNLSSFEAGGGGDTPEHVSKALSDAVERTHWSSGKNVIKLIYVVGDAPPHVDYNDGYDYKSLALKASHLGIRVNAIRCGDDAETERYFAEIARAGQGQFASIAQSGGMADVRTPYDDKLAGLNRKLMETAVGYGKDRDLRSRLAGALAAPTTVQADRASLFGKISKALGGSARNDDLVEAYGSGGLAAVAAIPAADLPAEVAAMAPPARADYVAHKKAERDEVLSEINSLAAQRQRFLKSKPAASRADSFDERVRRSIVDESAGVLKF